MFFFNLKNLIHSLDIWNLPLFKWGVIPWVAPPDIENVYFETLFPFVVLE